MPLPPGQTLTASVSENELGLIVFDFPSPTSSLIVFDSDLAENSTFSLYLNETLENDANRLSLLELNGYFGLNAEDANLPPVILGQSSVNLIVRQALDFEQLPSLAFIDTNTGIAFKFVKFVVKKIKFFSPLIIKLVNNFYKDLRTGII